MTDNNIEMDAPAKPKAWVSPLLASLCLSFTACVYAPLETYFATASEQWFNATDILPVSLLAFAVLAAVPFGVGILLRGRARSAFCGLLVGLSAALYVQAGFANADYGTFDGMGIDWSSFGSYPILNALMWAALVLAPAVLCAVFHKKVKTAIRFLSVILIFAQVAGTAALGFSAEKKPTQTMPTLTSKKIFDISKNSNVIMFVIDTFDSTSFSDMLKEYPELADRLEGFTWFKNAVGQYNMTSYAMPVIMTGECYLMEESQSTFREQSWERESFFKSLKNEGYSIGLYTEGSYAYASQEGIVDNALVQGIKPRSYTELWAEMMRLTAFRYLPHVLKPDFEGAGIAFGWMKQGAKEPIYVYENEPVLKMLRSNGVSADMSEPCFRMYHLSGMHPPYTLGTDEKDYEKEGEIVLRNSQAATLMNAVCDYLDMMKEQSVFDSSMIIITADHGLKYFDLRPLMLIKRPGDSGEFFGNDSLVSMTDLHRTIADAMNTNEKPQYGQNMFDIDADAMNETPYYDTHPDSGELYEYNVYLDDDYHTYFEPTGFAYRYRDYYEVERMEYSLGKKIKFDRKEDMMPWLDELSYQDVKNASKGPYIGIPDTTFFMYIADEDYDDLRVTLYLNDVVDGEQNYRILVKGETIAEGAVKNGDTELSFTVPYDYCSDYELLFTVRFPDVKSEYEKSGWEGGHTRLIAIRPTGMLIENITEE